MGLCVTVIWGLCAAVGRGSVSRGHIAVVQLIDLILHQGVGHDAEAEDRQNQRDDGKVGVAVVASHPVGFVKGFRLFVDPVDDVEGNKEAEHYFYPGAELLSAQHFAEVFADPVDPDEHIDAKGDDAEDDEKNNTNGIVFFAGNRRPSLTRSLSAGGCLCRAGTGLFSVGSRRRNTVIAEDAETHNGHEHRFEKGNKEISRGKSAADQSDQNLQ